MQVTSSGICWHVAFVGQFGRKREMRRNLNLLPRHNATHSVQTCEEAGLVHLRLAQVLLCPLSHKLLHVLCRQNGEYDDGNNDE